MPAERQAPDAVLDSTNYSTLAVGDIQDDPDSPDAAWGTWDDVQRGPSTCRVSFPSPTGSPTTGSGLQEFRVQIRKDTSGDNDPTWSLELWEDGAQVSVLATGTTTTAVGEVVSGTWDASTLGTSDGSLVECALIQTGGASGNPGKRRGIEVGAVEWNVAYEEAANTGDLSITLDALSRSATGAVAIAGDAALVAASLDTTTAGTVSITGDVAVTGAALTTTTDGGVLVTGDLIDTFGALSVDGAGTVGDPVITGDLARSLDILIHASAGTVAIVGDVAVGTGAMTATAMGAVPVAGEMTDTFMGVVISGGGTVGNGGGGNSSRRPVRGTLLGVM